MPLKFAKAPIIVMLTLSLGAHWALLQSVAWAGMIFDYSTEAGLRQGISMTFDGDHPCSLCNVIEEAKDQDQQQDETTVQPAKDLKLEPALRDFALYPPSVENPAVRRHALLQKLPRQPVDPPPRHLLS